MSTRDQRSATIQVDTTRCTGLGICEATAPAFFEVQDDGSLCVLETHVDPRALEDVQSAVASCPTEALRLVLK